MPYTGQVTVGGDADVRELSGLVVTKLAVGPMSNNVYLLRCRETGEQLMIDAAYDEDRLLALVGDAGLATVVTTHRHTDHVEALTDVIAATGATPVAGAADADALPVPVDVRVDDGDTVRVGRCSLSVIGLVGHTPGSIALRYDDADGRPHLFTGDSLFPGGPGRTTGIENFLSLMGDLEAKVFDVMPDETWIYTGHGDDTVLGAERPHLPEWRSRGW